MTASDAFHHLHSEAFAWAPDVLWIPQTVSEFIVSPGLGPVGFGGQRLPLLFGIFMEPLPGIMILVPILALVADAVGINSCSSR